MAGAYSTLALVELQTDWVKKNLGPKICWFQQFIGREKCWFHEKCVSKKDAGPNVWFKKYLVQENVYLKKILEKNKFQKNLA